MFIFIFICVCIYIYTHTCNGNVLFEATNVTGGHRPVPTNLLQEMQRCLYNQQNRDFFEGHLRMAMKHIGKGELIAEGVCEG